MALIIIKDGCFFIVKSWFTLSKTPKPSNFGITISKRTTSGSVSFIIWQASSPSLAVPTTSSSSSVRIISPNNRSILSLSSAIATFNLPISRFPSHKTICSFKFHMPFLHVLAKIETICIISISIFWFNQKISQYSTEAVGCPRTLSIILQKFAIFKNPFSYSVETCHHIPGILCSIE